MSDLTTANERPVLGFGSRIVVCAVVAMHAAAIVPALPGTTSGSAIGLVVCTGLAIAVLAVFGWPPSLLWTANQPMQPAGSLLCSNPACCSTIVRSANFCPSCGDSIQPAQPLVEDSPAIPRWR